VLERGLALKEIAAERGVKTERGVKALGRQFRKALGQLAMEFEK
jgi:hypothetical protein